MYLISIFKNFEFFYSAHIKKFSPGGKIFSLLTASCDWMILLAEGKQCVTPNTIKWQNHENWEISSPRINTSSALHENSMFFIAFPWKKEQSWPLKEQTCWTHSISLVISTWFNGKRKFIPESRVLFWVWYMTVSWPKSKVEISACLRWAGLPFRTIWNLRVPIFSFIIIIIRKVLFQIIVLYNIWSCLICPEYFLFVDWCDDISMFTSIQFAE